jgi:hypothetical protein
MPDWRQNGTTTYPINNDSTLESQESVVEPLSIGFG